MIISLIAGIALEPIYHNAIRNDIRDGLKSDRIGQSAARKLNIMELNWKIIKPIALTLKSGRVRNSYLIECKCGTRRTVHLSEWKKIENGTSKTNIGSGCRTCNLLAKSTEQKKDSAYKLLYSNLKSSCKRNDRKFTLTLIQATKLYNSNCFYCNRPPSNLYKAPYKNQFELYYNGIDRVDSYKGYTKDNVVPCCFYCNRAKSNLTQTEFFQLVRDIYSFRVHRLSEGSE